MEVLAHRSRSARTETEPAAPSVAPAVPVAASETDTAAETERETGRVITLAGVSATVEGEPTAQELMWAHVLKERERGRISTGAALDRVAGTNNYGRTVLRQWRE